ncbi:MAG: hypothetical protein KGJ98_08640 [Chloroflexota bacterium]|nr:hypothetical protein [Chloroflexota bacterium]
MKVDLDVPFGQGRAAPDAELVLFRIVQEALRNVERHAGATRVRVSLAFDPREVRAEIADDGAGFVVSAGQDFAAAGHLGLLGMRERAETLGGSLEIISRPHHGTRVVATIPYSRD